MVLPVEAGSFFNCATRLGQLLQGARGRVRGLEADCTDTRGRLFPGTGLLTGYSVRFEQWQSLIFASSARVMMPAALTGS